MAKYRITGPNGKTYRLEGPEGASQEDLVAQIRQRYPEDFTQKVPVSQMQDEMRQRGISENDINSTTDAMRSPSTDAELRLPPQQAKAAPAKPEGYNEMGRGTFLFSPHQPQEGFLNWLIQLLRDPNESLRTPMPRPQAPSLKTALLLTAPASYAPAAIATRMGIATGGSGLEAASAGKDPVDAMVNGAVRQGLTEAIAPVAGKAVQGAAGLIPGVRATRAAEVMAGAANKMANAPQAGPGYHIMYKGTGIPASTILGPTGAPMVPEIPAQVIPHPSYPGWTADNLLPEVVAKTVKPLTGPTEGLMGALLRGGSAMSQNPTQDPKAPRPSGLDLLQKLLQGVPTEGL
jgi:hypothetical protein